MSLHKIRSGHMRLKNMHATQELSDGHVILKTKIAKLQGFVTYILHTSKIVCVQYVVQSLSKCSGHTLVIWLYLMIK